MRVPFVVALLFLALPARAADLSKVDRAIKKEPAYTGRPHYCLLVFGPELRTKVWLVHDDDALYVDRNGNGDLTEAGERVPMPKFEKPDNPLVAEQREVRAGDIEDGSLRHSGLELTQARVSPHFEPKNREEQAFWDFLGKGKGGHVYGVSLKVQREFPPGTKSPIREAATADTRGRLQFAARPQDAPVINFGGGLAMSLMPCQNLVRGGKPGELRAWLGSPGLGAGTFAIVIFDEKPALGDQTDFLPATFHPVAEVEFPAAAGKQPLREKIVLNQRC